MNTPVSSPVHQLTLDIEPTVAERWPTLREFIAYRVSVQPKLQKVIAADMGLAPSMLSRKLHPGDGDTQRLTLDDLEGYLAATGDVHAVIEYLAAKFASGGDEGRRARAIARVESLLSELPMALAALKKGAA